MLSLTGVLDPQDLSIVIGAENIHRAESFQPDDTANIIFGDDSLATALKTTGNATRTGRYSRHSSADFSKTSGSVPDIASTILELNGNNKIDGIIIDNQLGNLIYRVPATSARVQHALAELMYPEQAAAGVFGRFKEALEFYDQNIRSFAYDIMSLDSDPRHVEKIARAYVESGKFNKVVSVYLAPDSSGKVTVHEGVNYQFKQPQAGIIDTLTRTHGCFGNFIQAVPVGDEIFGDMDGKGVFLYATRGAKAHLNDLFNEGFRCQCSGFRIW
jgi:hypothetical protein